jgi:hypothetical protein
MHPFGTCRGFLVPPSPTFPYAPSHPGRSDFPIPPSHLRMHSSGDFYLRTPHGSLPPRVPDILAVRTGQLTAGDFHPIRSAALSAVPRTPVSPARRSRVGCENTGYEMFFLIFLAITYNSSVFNLLVKNKET